MTTLFAQELNRVNPEAFINATIAARAAELAASQAFYISLGIIAILLVIGAAIMFAVYKLYELERNTDGMRKDLVEATRKLALMEGEVLGRANKENV